MRPPPLVGQQEEGCATLGRCLPGITPPTHIFWTPALPPLPPTHAVRNAASAGPDTQAAEPRLHGCPLPPQAPEGTREGHEAGPNPVKLPPKPGSRAAAAADREPCAAPARRLQEELQPRSKGWGRRGAITVGQWQPCGAGAPKPQAPLPHHNPPPLEPLRPAQLCQGGRSETRGVPARYLIDGDGSWRPRRN